MFPFDSLQVESGCPSMFCWKLRVRMFNGGLRPKRWRLTHVHQWSHWYMKGRDRWRERACVCVWVRVSVSECARVTVCLNQSTRCGVWSKLQTFMFARAVTAARMRFFHERQTYAACIPAAVASFIPFLNEFHFLQGKHQRGFCCWPHTSERRRLPAAPNRGTKSDKKSVERSETLQISPSKPFWPIKTSERLILRRWAVADRTLASARYQQGKEIEGIQHLHRALW